MGLIYQNIDFHNVCDFLPDDGKPGKIWTRVPLDVKAQLEMGMSDMIAISAVTVELRFVLLGDRAVLHLAKQRPDDGYIHHVHVFYGGIQGGWSDHAISRCIEGDCGDIVIERPKNIETLRKMSDLAQENFSPEVVRVIFDRGYYRYLGVDGDIRAPLPHEYPKETLLTYGSSITQGSNSIDSSHAWPSLLAKDLHMDLRNLAFAGSCAMEDSIVDYLASEGEAQRWSMAVLELGINVLFWEESKIRKRVENTIRQIAGRNPNKPVYVISPLFCEDDFHGGNQAQRWRDIIKEIAYQLAYSNVIVIDGLELLDNITLLSADEVHPNIYGVAQIAERLIEKIRKDKI
ncbi:MAG: hypothetical protein IJA67_00275 [Oscillospiraceae bacterium]|nr:hypothetical protein [Oscillospiraceae bacterium]